MMKLASVNDYGSMASFSLGILSDCDLIIHSLQFLTLHNQIHVIDFLFIKHWLSPRSSASHPVSSRCAWEVADEGPRTATACREHRWSFSLAQTCLLWAFCAWISTWKLFFSFSLPSPPPHSVLFLILLPLLLPLRPSAFQSILKNNNNNKPWPKRGISCFNRLGKLLDRTCLYRSLR